MYVSNPNRKDTYLAISADLRLLLSLLLGSNGPVHEEKINVSGSQTPQGVVQGPDNIVVAVQVVPNLSRDEEILPLNGCVFLQEVLDSLADLILVEIVPSTVKVPVSGAESVEDGVVSLALAALTGEGTETHGGNSDTVAQLEGESVRHFDCLSKQRPKR